MAKRIMQSHTRMALSAALGSSQNSRLHNGALMTAS